MKGASLHLKNVDPVLRRIIRGVGPCGLKSAQGRGGVFESLAEAIFYQQLNGRAAETILGRFRGLYKGRGFPKPEQVLGTPDAKLRSVGLSRQKLSYLKDLARHAKSGGLEMRRLKRMNDGEVVEALTEVKGVGRWTAEMFLMFRLGRPDVLPVGDYGLRAAVKRSYRLRELPDAKRLEALGEKWRPWRSAATWYMWASLDGKG